MSQEILEEADLFLPGPVLRDYQLRAVAEIGVNAAYGHRRILLQAPTGSGKMVLAAQVIKDAVDKGNRVLFLAHRRELINQCADKLELFGVPNGTMLAGDEWDSSHKVNVCSIQTLHSWAIQRKKIHNG